MVSISLSSSRGYLRILCTGFISRDCKSQACVSALCVCVCVCGGGGGGGGEGRRREGVMGR